MFRFEYPDRTEMALGLLGPFSSTKSITTHQTSNPPEPSYRIMKNFTLSNLTRSESNKWTFGVYICRQNDAPF